MFGILSFFSVANFLGDFDIMETKNNTDAQSYSLSIFGSVYVHK